MPFLLYQRTLNKNGTHTFTQVKDDVSLGGKKSPIASYVQDEYAKAKNKEGPLRWHMSEADLLEKLGVSANDYALIIDLKPKKGGNVSLYQIKDIWGFSSFGWTPIALRLESLFVDKPSKNPDIFKKQFDDREAERELIHEFLYLNGDANSGEWKWGMAGNVNAVLLWPEVLKYFMNEISKDL